MRGAISAVFTIGLIVMLYCGRSTWMSGGGVIMPQLSSRVVEAGGGKVLVLTNTGNETLVHVRSSTTRWNLHQQTPLCRELPPGQELRIPMVGNHDAEQIFIFADSYAVPASFVLKPLDNSIPSFVKNWLPESVIGAFQGK